MGEYFVLVQPWAVYVKEGKFFRSQGGLTEEWGKNWKRVEARSLDHARDIAVEMQEEMWPISEY